MDDSDVSGIGTLDLLPDRVLRMKYSQHSVVWLCSGKSASYTGPVADCRRRVLCWRIRNSTPNKRRVPG
ncbi:hypothetical protein KCP75_11135 [Salmonella enterica subsp. enterica]|nr:hypothetical protein KCP75_11135 [Salmonella enterica subsp. enterica]